MSKLLNNIYRYIVRPSRSGFKVYQQTKGKDGNGGPILETAHKIDEVAFHGLQQQMKAELKSMGIDPENIPDKQHKAALSKSMQITMSKILVRHENAEMAVVKQWAEMMAAEWSVPVDLSYMKIEGEEGNTKARYEYNRLAEA